MTTSRQIGLLWGLVALALIAFSPLAPELAATTPACPVKSISGLPCPTCGSTRGSLALLDGRILDALAFNPLVMSSGIAFVIGGLLAPLWAWKISKIPDLDRSLPMAARIAIVALVVLNWAYLVFVFPALPLEIVNG